MEMTCVPMPTLCVRRASARVLTATLTRAVSVVRLLTFVSVLTVNNSSLVTAEVFSALCVEVDRFIQIKVFF